MSRAVREKVLIGSAAVEERAPGLLGRPCADVDYLTLKPVAGHDSIDGRGILDVYPFASEVASLSEVYTLKVSHSPWMGKGYGEWFKHLKDIRALQEAGAVLVPALHSAAYRQWEERKGRKLVNLNQDKETFFHGGVRRVYDHDSVHAAVALGEEPAFNLILREGSEVAVDRSRFETLALPSKKRLVFEETMVLSLERDLIPRSERGEIIDEWAILRSYTEQLSRVITQYSKGWWPQWIIENYFLVQHPPLNYWELFQDSPKKVRL